MKNLNYNLVKLLHAMLDVDWRIEKHYLNDAKDKCPSCEKLLADLRQDAEKHLAALREEVARHGKLD